MSHALSKRLNASAKSNNPDLLELSTQADLGQTFHFFFLSMSKDLCTLKIVVIMDPKVLLYMLYNRDASTISQIILTFIDLEKEAFWSQNIAVTSIFSFSHNILFSSQNKFQFLSHIYFVFCKCFILNWSKVLSFGKEFSPLFRAWFNLLDILPPKQVVHVLLAAKVAVVFVSLNLSQTTNF